MKLLKTILVAVEVDDASRHVVTEAGTLARKFGSEVVLSKLGDDRLWGRPGSDHVARAADQ